MTLSRLRRRELNRYAAELNLYAAELNLCGAATLEATSSNALLSGLHAHTELNLYAAELNLYGAATLEATSSNALLSGLHAHAEAAKDEALQQLADQASLPCRRLYLCDCVTV